MKSLEEALLKCLPEDERFCRVSHSIYDPEEDTVWACAWVVKKELIGALVKVIYNPGRGTGITDVNPQYTSTYEGNNTRSLGISYIDSTNEIVFSANVCIGRREWLSWRMPFDKVIEDCLSIRNEQDTRDAMEYVERMRNERR